IDLDWSGGLVDQPAFRRARCCAEDSPARLVARGQATAHFASEVNPFAYQTQAVVARHIDPGFGAAASLVEITLETLAGGVDEVHVLQPALVVEQQGREPDPTEGFVRQEPQRARARRIDVRGPGFGD